MRLIYFCLVFRLYPYDKLVRASRRCIQGLIRERQLDLKDAYMHFNLQQSFVHHP